LAWFKGIPIGAWNFFERKPGEGSFVGVRKPIKPEELVE
jgi:hypothetical protein